MVKYIIVEQEPMATGIVVIDPGHGGPAALAAQMAIMLAVRVESKKRILP